jgi:hypothetical protein
METHSKPKNEKLTSNDVKFAQLSQNQQVLRNGIDLILERLRIITCGIEYDFDTLIGNVSKIQDEIKELKDEIKELKNK